MGIIDDDRHLKFDRLNHRQVQKDELADRNKRRQNRQHASQKRRRVVLSGRELKDKVMELFGKQAYWPRNDLLAEVGNADGLSACLNDICVKVTKKGPHCGDFQLKPALRTGLPSGKS